MPDHAPYRSGETARHFRRLYLVALSLIAALAIGGQLLVQRSLTLQLDDGHVVNQAGYQRMLSQRITLKMMLLDADGPGTRSDVATIAAMRDRWLATHRQLLDRVARIAHNDDARQALRHLFAEAGQPLQRISSLVTRRMERGGLSATERAGLLADQELFLPLMDAIVLGLEHSVQARVRLLQRVEIALLCVTLVVLGLEAMLIFRPAVNRLQASLDQVERRNRLATRRLESLRRLAGGIAHHFNNILTAILGNAVLERMEALRRNRNTEYIDAQIQGCRRAAKIITELVAYSGYGDYKLEPVALAPWLTEIAGFRDPADFPLQLRIEIPGDAVAKIDQVALKQALDGLIANAGEAMLGAGGSTTLRLSQAMLTEPRLMCGPYSAELPAGLYAVFQVIDEGKGMARDDLDHIFDPFYTNKEFGRGLGLASILGIVHGHDGGIAVESTLGRGSTVSLFIPLAGPEPGSAGPSDARAARSGQQQN